MYLSSAGRVAAGARDQEAKLRKAREEQLALEALNRQNTARKIDATAPLPELGSFGDDRAPMGVGVRAPAAGVAVPPAAPRGPAIPPAQNPTTSAGKPPVAAPPPAQPPQMTQAEFMALSPEKRALHLQTANDKRRGNQVAAGGYYALSGLYDAGAAPINAAAWAVEKGANAVGWPRIGRAVGLYGPETKEVTVPRIGDGSLTPMANSELRNIEANSPLTEQQYMESLPLSNAVVNKGGDRGRAGRIKNTKGGVAIPGGALGAEGFASEKAASRYEALTSKLPAALQSPATQQLLSRAQALGVDPAAAMSIYGIETTFGANSNTSGKGASGPMQVTDDTFAGMKRWFTDPANGAPSELQAAAAALVRGNPQSEIDAGLLRIKYNELVGVPRALWGAAYQANAEKVRDNGAPMPYDDGHFTNGEYNSVFVNLYNQVAGAMGGGAGPLPGATATLAANDGPALRQAVAAGGAAPATAPVPTAAPAAAPGATRSAAQFYLADPQALGRDIKLGMQQRAELVRMAQMYQQSGMGVEYRQARQALMAHDAQLTNLAGIQAVQQLEFANDPTALSKMLSHVQEQQIDLKPYTDGSFDVYINGKLAQQNVPGETIKDQALSLFDEGYRAQKATMAQESFKGSIADRSEVVKQTAQMVRELKLEQFKGDVSMAVKYLEKTTGWKTQVVGDGSGTVLLFPPGEANPVYWSPQGGTVTRDGVTMTTNGAKPIAGLAYNRTQ